MYWQGKLWRGLLVSREVNQSEFCNKATTDLGHAGQREEQHIKRDKSIAKP